jgi:lipopolysaccharide transport system ATP-binding protein
MRVRLAFSVAAHLEPEILIVDEVLAVGDATFQARCLGKLHSAADHGRTVLFVSHNLGALRGLCNKGLLIDDGRVITTGSVGEVVDHYLHSASQRLDFPLAERSDRSGDGALRFVAVHLLAGSPLSESTPPTPGSPLVFAIGFESPPGRPANNVRMAVTVRDLEGRRLLVADSRFLNVQYKSLPGRGQVLVEIPRFPLAAGEYEIDLWATSADQVADYIVGAARFRVTEGNPFGTGRTTEPAKHGPFVVDQVWHEAEALEGVDTDWIQRVTRSIATGPAEHCPSTDTLDKET